MESPAPTYVLRYRKEGHSVVECDASFGVPQLREPALAYALVLCEIVDTNVVVVESGSLICIVHPDAPGIPETPAAPSVV